MSAWREVSVAGLGAGGALGAIVGVRLLVPHPALRFLLTIGAGAATFLLPATWRPAPLGIFVVSGVVDLVHLKAYVQHADASRSGIRALEEELARAPALGLGRPIAAA